MNRLNQLTEIHQSGKPYIIYKSKNGFNLYTNFSKKIILDNKNVIYRDLLFDKKVSKVSIIGVGMITTPGVTFRMFQKLADKKINILVISTSEIKISVLIEKKNVAKALKALHEEFKLNR